MRQGCYVALFRSMNVTMMALSGEVHKRRMAPAKKSGRMDAVGKNRKEPQWEQADPIRVASAASVPTDLTRISAPSSQHHRFRFRVDGSPKAWAANVIVIQYGLPDLDRDVLGHILRLRLSPTDMEDRY